MAKIGFVGLGQVGKGICNNLIKAGHELCVYDVNPVAMERFRDIAVLAADIKEVCRCSEYIFLSLPNSEIVEATVDAFLEAGVEGKIVIDTSTSYPGTTKTLYEKLKAAGGNLVDAPLMAGPAEAEAGILEIVVGGDLDVVEKLRFLFDAYCKEVKYVGKVGNGHLAKLAVNCCGLTQVLVMATLFPVMEKHGFDPKELNEFLNCGALSNWMSRFYGEKYMNRDYRLDFDLALGCKDLTYAKKLYEDLHVPAFMLDGALDLCNMALQGRAPGEIRDFSYPCQTMHELVEQGEI